MLVRFELSRVTVYSVLLRYIGENLSSFPEMYVEILEVFCVMESLSRKSLLTSFAVTLAMPTSSSSDILNIL